MGEMIMHSEAFKRRLVEDMVTRKYGSIEEATSASSKPATCLVKNPTSVPTTSGS
jgi:hypothetical protein